MNWIKKLFGQNDKAGPEKVVPIMSVDLPPNEGPIELYQDQVMRKAWAEQMLEEQGIPINKHLPCIEGEAETILRSPQEVADRLLALAIVASKGAGLEQEQVIEVVNDRDVRRLFTPNELSFIDDAEPCDHDRLQFSWRYEAAWVLYWALNFSNGLLDFPAEICDVDALVETVRDTDDLAINGLQSANNILNEADLIYRYHWAVRQASIDGEDQPGGLHEGVVMERHYALNWLIRCDNQEWDDISTDT